MPEQHAPSAATYLRGSLTILLTWTQYLLPGDEEKDRIHALMAGQPAAQTACVSCRAKPELDAQGDSLGRTMVTGSCPQLRRMHINSYMVQVRSSVPMGHALHMSMLPGCRWWVGSRSQTDARTIDKQSCRRGTA